MDRLPSIRGVVEQAATPDWAPLEAVIGDALAEWFMWMYEVQLADGSQLHAYKHVTTRRYLHLTSGGRAFDYRGHDGRYREVGVATAIIRAFTGWERAQPPPRHVRAMHEAVESARGLAA
jgi:hypothetical protein